MRSYQLEYASGRRQMYDTNSRERRAERIVKVLQNYFGEKKLKTLKVLDVGSSTGIVDSYLANYVGQIVGIDIDKGAIANAKRKYKKKNLNFEIGDAMKLKYQTGTFDVVICAQVYEHVPDSKRLFNEINKVLKPGGVCYLSAMNKFTIIEPHYNLPFLSWLPKPLANKYVLMFGRAQSYYESPESYWRLKELTGQFRIEDYTTKIIVDPKKFSYSYKLLNRVPKVLRGCLLAPIAKYMSPSFIWLLVKD